MGLEVLVLIDWDVFHLMLDLNATPLDPSAFHLQLGAQNGLWFRGEKGGIVVTVNQ